MPARAFCLLRENRRQPRESLHSNSLMVKEQKWLNTKRRNSWAWMSDDKCISTRWHFHHYLIDHLGDILNCGPCVRLCVCVWYAESDCLRSVPLLNTRTHCDRYRCKEDVEIWDCYRDPDVYVPQICLNFLYLFTPTPLTMWRNFHTLQSGWNFVHAAEYTITLIIYSAVVCKIFPCMQMKDKGASNSWQGMWSADDSQTVLWERWEIASSSDANPLFAIFEALDFDLIM